MNFTSTFEDELEKEKLMIHEHKNQLAVIRDMTKNQKLIKYIDDILKNYNVEKDSIRGINNLPKGGLRGLIYYKLTVMKTNGVNYSLDISKSVKNTLSKVSSEELKVLSYILGVSIDNAIEECYKNKDSNIAIEVYRLDNEINIVISNTIMDKVNIKKVGEKGYSTKGKGRGNGIFLVKKMLNNYENITIHTEIINNYYVQKVKIKV